MHPLLGELDDDDGPVSEPTEPKPVRKGTAIPASFIEDPPVPPVQKPKRTIRGELRMGARIILKTLRARIDKKIKSLEDD
jgi:hypothetical protein